MPYATTKDNVKLYYEEAGSGTPVVFVHEFAGDYRSWELQVREFSRTYCCITFNAVRSRCIADARVRNIDTSAGEKG